MLFVSDDQGHNATYHVWQDKPLYPLMAAFGNHIELPASVLLFWCKETIEDEDDGVSILDPSDTPTSRNLRDGDHVVATIDPTTRKAVEVYKRSAASDPPKLQPSSFTAPELECPGEIELELAAQPANAQRIR